MMNSLKVNTTLKTLKLDYMTFPIDYGKNQLEEAIGIFF